MRNLPTRNLLSTFIIIVSVLPARAGFFSSDPPSSPQQPVQEYSSETSESCSEHLFTALTLHPSAADEACKDQHDLETQTCLINLTNGLDNRKIQNPRNDLSTQDVFLIKAASLCRNRSASIMRCAREFNSYVTNFGDEYLPATTKYCSTAKHPSYGRCVGMLYKNGGLTPEQSGPYCETGLAAPVIDCVTSRFRTRGEKGAGVITSCKDMYDPAVIARRQAEQRRLEEERRGKEAAQKAADEARRKADEQKRKDEEAKKNNGVGTTPAPNPAPQPAPQDPSNSGGGVIVDLPNF